MSIPVSFFSTLGLSVEEVEEVTVEEVVYSLSCLHDLVLVVSESVSAGDEWWWRIQL